jgi:hypothetical protein
LELRKDKTAKQGSKDYSNVKSMPASRKKPLSDRERATVLDQDFLSKLGDALE